MKLLKFEEYSLVTESIRYHLDNGLSISESIYRIGSDAYCDFVCEIRKLHKEGKIELDEEDQFIVEKLNTGVKAIFKIRGSGDKLGKTINVVLDTPEVADKDETSKYIVYRDSGKKEDGKILAYKIGFGSKDHTIENCGEENEGRRKSFLARHQCDEKTLEKDGDSAGWWSCNVHKFRKQLKLKCNNPW